MLLTLFALIAMKFYANGLNQIKGDNDTKMIGLLMGIQAGNTQHSCFLCQWRSRGKNQYHIEDWQMRNEYLVGEQNINVIH